jgi:hypothetical protein
MSQAVKAEIQEGFGSVERFVEAVELRDFTTILDYIKSKCGK